MNQTFEELFQSADQMAPDLNRVYEAGMALVRENKILRYMLGEVIRQYEPVLDEDIPQIYDQCVVDAFIEMHNKAKGLLDGQ